MLRNGDATGVPMKLLGDIYLARNKKIIAKEYYLAAKKDLRNGLMLLDLENTLKRICDE